jgi:hypothetical protein
MTLTAILITLTVAVFALAGTAWLYIASEPDDTGIRYSQQNYIEQRKREKRHADYLSGAFYIGGFGAILLLFAWVVGVI